jgi:hypothetical protein
LHFIAVGVGLKLMNAPDGVGVFWPATGTLFAFLLLYPARYWLALLVFGFLAEILSNEAFAPPQIPYTMAGLLFFVKFGAGLAGVLARPTGRPQGRSPSRACITCWASRRRPRSRPWPAPWWR